MLLWSLERLARVNSPSHRDLDTGVGRAGGERRTISNEPWILHELVLDQPQRGWGARRVHILKVAFVLTPENHRIHSFQTSFSAKRKAKPAWMASTPQIHTHRLRNG